MERRSFLKNTTLSLAGICSSIPAMMARPAKDFIKLTIVHTNDTHSRIDPFPQDGSRYAGKGGMAKRAELIKKLRASNEHLLLLDSGDIFQGTPYFNFFGGEVEFRLMSEMGYDASTIGNHDFDAGIEGLYKQLPHAHFPFVVSNYDFRDTVMHESTQKYIIKEVGPLRIGIIGVGIELEGLVPQSLYKNTRYLDPLPLADDLAKKLKKKEDVDLVICLSHLGYQYFDKKIDDIKLAQNSSHIDLILGGHTHTFLPHPTLLKNDAGHPVLINQVGWSGIMVGKIDLFFSKNKSRGQISSSNLIIK